MKKILVFGMYNNAMYHPLTGVDKRLQTIAPDMNFTFTEQITEVCNADNYDGVISYWDDWNTPVPDQVADALCRYVAGGGSLLLLHNGISIQLQEPLRKMVGGCFLSHPAQEEITCLVKEHELTKECHDFSLVEEPYQFELEKDEKDIFFTYIYRNNEYPAGWKKGFGKGELIFLMPGHTPEKFEHPQYAKLIRNCMNYLFCRKEE